MSDLLGETAIETIYPTTVDSQIEQHFNDSQVKFTTDLEHGYRIANNRSRGTDIVNRSFLYDPSTGSSFTVSKVEVINPKSELKFEQIIQRWKDGEITKSISLMLENSREKSPIKTTTNVDVRYYENNEEKPYPKEKAALIAGLMRDYINAEFDPEKTNAEFQRLKREGQNVQWNTDPNGGDN